MSYLTLVTRQFVIIAINQTPIYAKNSFNQSKGLHGRSTNPTATTTSRQHGERSRLTMAIVKGIVHPSLLSHGQSTLEIWS